jgi:hypothetical protein
MSSLAVSTGELVEREVIAARDGVVGRPQRPGHIDASEMRQENLATLLGPNSAGKTASMPGVTSGKQG